MKFVTETPTTDLSGATLFPLSADFEAMFANDGYLVAELVQDVPTGAFLQAESSFTFDYDTFVADLDAGDTYQIRLHVEDTSFFESNVQLNVKDTSGRNVGLIQNDYGDIFDTDNALLTDSFSSKTQGSHFIFTGLRNSGGDKVAAAYSLELIKVTDIQPWVVSLEQDGNGGTATLTAGDQMVAAGSSISVAVTFSNGGMSLEDVSLVGSGSLSTYQYSTSEGTRVSSTVTPAFDTTLKDLLEFTFLGGSSAGQVQIVDLTVQVDSSQVPVEVFGTLSTPGNQTLRGRAKDDVISGDVGGDLIKGVGGNDSLFGLLGDDTLVGGKGNDALDGGGNDDLLRGQAGNDDLVGALGDDSLVGNGGSDTLSGESGNDLLSGGGGSDSLSGGVGRDRLNGNGGNDELMGAAANDVLSGGGGHDTLYGGSGKDQLSGDKGNDFLYGGAARDKFEFSKGSRVDTIMDFEDDVDTLLLDTSLWGNSLSKKQVLKMYAIEGDDSVTLDFGKDKIVVEGIDDAELLQNDIAFL